MTAMGLLSSWAIGAAKDCSTYRKGNTSTTHKRRRENVSTVSGRQIAQYAYCSSCETVMMYDVVQKGGSTTPYRTDKVSGF